MVRTRETGFPFTRKRDLRRRGFCWPLPRWVWAAALAALLWILGLTRAWPQSSGSSSSGSAEHLTTWTLLSDRFEETLSEHERTLSELSEKLGTSEHNGARLSDLLNQSLTQNEDLRSYNEQIAERMRERDEDLAAAYQDINRLEKNSLRHWIVHVVMGAIILGYAALKIAKFFI